MRVVSSVQFIEDGSVVLVYMDPSSDVRNRGLVVQSHQIHIARGQDAKDYGDEIDMLVDAAKRLLDDALDDWESTEPVGPATDDNVR
jgi:hypothetical protein